MPKNIKTKSIDLFRDKLLLWFRVNRRHFPWREEGLSAYSIIISEVLLQRTKAEKVRSFYPSFISAFPDWQALSHAELNSIETHLIHLGLHRQRAVRLKSLANEIAKRNGKIPDTREELEKLPLFGQYIANAVELLVFRRPMPLLDVNMARVLERYFGERELSDIRFDAYLQGLALRVVTHEQSKEVNWAILDFSALVCRSQRPKCNECCLSFRCRFLKTNKNQ